MCWNKEVKIGFFLIRDRDLGKKLAVKERQKKEKTFSAKNKCDRNMNE